VAHLIDKAILDAATDLPGRAELLDACQNIIALYYAYHDVFPRYLYVNDETWEKYLRFDLGDWVEGMALEVIDSPFMPKNRVSVHYNYHPHREIATWHRSFDDEAGIESGRLELV
jgi:hypothetical protein